MLLANKVSAYCLFVFFTCEGDYETAVTLNWKQIPRALFGVTLTIHDSNKQANFQWVGFVVISSAKSGKISKLPLLSQMRRAGKSKPAENAYSFQIFVLTKRENKLFNKYHNRRRTGNWRFETSFRLPYTELHLTISRRKSIKGQAEY